MTSLADEELVLLTSYFNISNGRRQDTADTFRVDPSLPSTTSPSGTAALYIVTEASGGAHMGPRARRLAADTIAWEYSTHGHEPPAKRLRAAILAAHQEVQREFDGHIAVGVSVIAVEHNDVFLAQVAPAQVYVLHDGNLHSNSPEAGAGSPFARAIGSSRTPQIALARDQIAEGDVLAICSSWFAHGANAEEIRECFELGTADDISAGLFDLCERSNARDATAIVIEAIREADLRSSGDDEEDPGGFLEQVDGAVQTLANVGRMLVAELKPAPEDLAVNGGRAPRSADRLANDDDEEFPLEADPYDDSDDAPARPERAQRRRGLWGSSRRSPGTRGESIADDEAAAPDAAPFQDLSWEDDPFATREVPAVSDESEQGRPQSQVADPWNPEETTTYDLGDLRGGHPITPPESSPRRREQPTEEVPSVPPEAWTETIDAENVQSARADVPASASTPPLEEPIGQQSESDVAPPFDYETEADTEPDDEHLPRPRFRRRRPRRPFREERDDQFEPAEETDEDIENRARAEIDEVNSRLQDDLDMSEVIPPVQGFTDAGTEPSRIYATSKDIQAVNRRPRRFGGLGKPDDSSAPPRVVRPSQDLNLRRPISRPAPNAVTWFAAAAIGIFAILAVFLAIKHFTATTTRANPYPARVRHDISLVAQAKTFEQKTHRLSLAQQDLKLAKQNGAPPATITRLRALISTTSDSVYSITRVAAPVIVGKFQQPTEIATGATDLYVLDPGKGALYSVQQNSTAAPTEIVTSGEVDGSTTVGKMTQVASAGGTALVLDENNALVRDDGTTKTATVLAKPSANQKVVGMINSGPDVFLLDPVGAQVWRYPDAVAGYDPAPTGFFQSGVSSLSSAVSFTMDDSAMYILDSNKTVLKFDLQAQQQAFNLNLHVPLVHPTAIFTDVGLKYIWIADPGAGRIVQVDKSGNYVRSYASSNTAMNFKQLKSIAVQPDGKELYALAGNQVYRFGVTP